MGNNKNDSKPGDKPGEDEGTNFALINMPFWAFLALVIWATLHSFGCC